MLWIEKLLLSPGINIIKFECVLYISNIYIYIKQSNIYYLLLFIKYVKC